MEEVATLLYIVLITREQHLESDQVLLLSVQSFTHNMRWRMLLYFIMSYILYIT